MNFTYHNFIYILLHIEKGNIQSLLLKKNIKILSIRLPHRQNSKPRPIKNDKMYEIFLN